MINPFGVLTYDKDSMTYFIAPARKLLNRDTVGNLLALNRGNCMLTAEGKLSLGVNLGRVTANVVGKVYHNTNSHETVLDVMAAFNFHFDDALAGMIATGITGFEGLTGVDMQRTTYFRGMNEWLGVKKAESFRRDAALGKVNNFPDELKKTLVLTQLRLHWNQSNRSWRSSGKIGVGNLFGYQVNRQVDGMVEISKRLGGDYMDIYLKLDERNWYYFGYTRGLMQVISSDQTFNDRLMKIPEKQRKIDDRQRGYTYMIASDDKLNQFLRQYQQRETPTDQMPQPPTMIQDAGKAVTPPSSVTPPEKKEEDVPIIEVE
jgi:hypothetical protein